MPAKSLLDILKEKNILSGQEAAVLAEEARRSGRSIEDILYEKGRVTEKEIIQAKAEASNLPLKTFGPAERIPVEVLEIIPEEAARNYRIMPLAKKGDVLEVGIVNPEDVRAQEAIKFIARSRGLSVKIYLVAPSDLDKVLSQYRSFRGEVKKALEELRRELVPEKPVGAVPGVSIEEPSRLMEEAPIIKMVAVVLKNAVEGRASDVHIEPETDKLRIRFRVDGILFSSLFLPINVHSAIISRIKILANLKIDENRIPQDGRFHTRIENKEIDIRVSTLPTADGEKAALRILDPTIGLKNIVDLGLEGRNLEILNNEIRKPFGMILLTGPTGSGKTTTLYSILQILNKDQVNVISLEDPVEYFIEGVNQSQIRPELGYDFATGLRHVLRQDPDIMMVGEIRDEETAELAIHAALTGHIVLSTLHTNNAVGIIPRLIDMKVQPFLLPSALHLGVAQRLLRRLCPYCKKETEAQGKEKEIILEEVKKLPENAKKTLKITEPIKIYEPQGCPRCNQKGFIGRIALFEILMMTPELEKVILEKPSEQKIEEEARRQDMITLRQDGILKVLKGVVSLGEVLDTVAE